LIHTIKSINISLCPVSGTFLVGYVFTRSRLLFIRIVYKHSVRTAQ